MDWDKLLEPLYKQAGCTITDGLPFAKISIGCGLAMFAWETYLETRRLKKLSDTEINPTLLKIIREIDEEKAKKDGSVADGKTLEAQALEKFANSQAYGRDKAMFSLTKRTYGLIEGLALFKLGFQPYVWDVAGVAIQAAFGLNPATSFIPRTLVYFGIGMAVETITSLPWNWYHHYVLEEKHGFNKMTYSTWVKDMFKELGLGVVIGGPILAGMLKVVDLLNTSTLASGLTAFTFASSLFLMAIYPDFIAPLMNDFTPLKDGELRTAIEALAVDRKFPLKKLYVMDGSTRSAHSNAYFFGFGSNKRIVLFDTLLEQANTDEIVAILGHELGHWDHMHVWKGFCLAQIQTFAMIHGCSYFLKDPKMFADFGFVDQPFMMGLELFSATVWSPVSTLLDYLAKWQSRRNEFEADQYSKDLNHAAPLSRGLVKLQLENASEMSVDPLYASWHYTHPTLIERISALRIDDKKTQ